MFLKRIFVVSLFLVGFSSAATSSVTEAEDKTQSAINLLAIESLCVKATPASNSSVENALDSDPNTDEALRTEVQRVKADPAYKSKIQSTAVNMSSSIVATKIPDMCTYYLPKH
ncbi:hypothetical protein ACTACG_21480 [Pseudomonas syringae]|uniref:hypothetical protein n=1 Tax=Pseudomonas syringae TaxID=317 RepID=UPI003F74F43C